MKRRKKNKEVKMIRRKTEYREKDEKLFLRFIVKRKKKKLITK